MYALVLLVLLLFFNTVSPQENTAKIGNQPKIFGEGKDYFPLGILGGYGWPEKDGFRIKRITKESYLFQAGIREDDLILKINENMLSQEKTLKARWLSFGKVLENLSKKPSNEKILLLEYQRQQEMLKTTVQIHSLQTHQENCPYICNTCQKMAESALSILAQKMEKEGSLPTSLAATNGTCVVSSMGLLAFTASASKGKSEKYASEIQQLLRFLTKNAGKDPIDQAVKRSGNKDNWNQTNWAWCFAGISANLWYQSSKDSRAKSLAHKAAGALIKNQKKSSGGWGHGPGGANALGYNEFWLVTGLALTTIALSQQNGRAVPADTIEKAKHYLEQCISASGGVGYGTHNPAVPDVARTAVAILALSALGQKKDPQFTRLSQWFLANLPQIEQAHQGYLLHLLLAGLAAREIGKEAFKQYWDEFHLEIFLAQKENSGLFTTRPTPETLRNQSSNDIALGDIWATAVYATIIQLGQDRLPRFAPKN